jgi:hypothetical protein
LLDLGHKKPSIEGFLLRDSPTDISDIIVASSTFKDEIPLPLLKFYLRLTMMYTLQTWIILA